MPGFNHWRAIAAQIKPEVQWAVSEVAAVIEQAASGNAPVDTGFLSSSVYSSTPKGSTYGSAGSPPGNSYLLPEEKPPDDMSAVVGVAANYGIYVELGHHVHNSTTYVPANPYFYPAVEQGRKAFDDALQQVADSLGVGLGGSIT